MLVVAKIAVACIFGYGTYAAQRGYRDPDPYGMPRWYAVPVCFVVGCAIAAVVELILLLLGAALFFLVS